MKQKETIDNWFNTLKSYHVEFYKRHSKIIFEYSSCKDELIIPSGTYKDNLTEFEVI
jgi:hypothetical protein